MSTETNKQTCRLFLQTVFNEGRLGLASAFLSPDAVHHDLGLDAEEARCGSEPLVENLYLYRFAFPDLRVEIQDMVAEGDRVVTRLVLTGTHTQRLMGIAASGRRVRISGVRIDRLAEGHIVESWFHWDSLGMLEQIGALPALDRRPAKFPQPPAQPRVQFPPFPAAAVPAAVEVPC
jgi:steroid delta-isomerase-like uncharacterized protein